MKKKTKNIIFDILGWYGAVAELSAYILVSAGVVSPRHIIYQLLNLTGAFGLGAICYHKRTYQPLFVNSVWFVIAIIEITNIAFIYFK
jgi:hypothetical protein